jgi:glyoxylase-like metal-dependent hydrolase (beta-lactamase superfamily II)
MAEIARGVFVATSPVYLTNSTIVVGAGGGCLVIDPALTVAELAGMGEWLTGRGLRPAVGWATHPHWDHVLWSRALGMSAPRYATAGAVAATARARAEMAGELEAEAPGHDLELLGRLDVIPAPGNHIPWDGPQAQVIEHEGHARGHAAIWLPDSGVLVAGDMLSDVEIPLPDMASADPLGDYRRGLALLASVPQVRRVVPGHGHVGGQAALRARVAMDLSYLDAVAAGRDASDQRLLGPDAAWQRAEHSGHRDLARRPASG